MERIRKVPIEPLIDLLTSLFNNGVDFVDISGSPTEDPHEDAVLFSIYESYIHPDYLEDFIENTNDQTSSEEVSNIKVEKLTDKDINNLL